jgi:hypothetical protein
MQWSQKSVHTLPILQTRLKIGKGNSDVQCCFIMLLGGSGILLSTIAL